MVIDPFDSQNTKVLSRFTDGQTTRFTQQFKEFQLAFGLQEHLLSYRTELESVCAVDDKKRLVRFDWHNAHHRSLLRSLISTTITLTGQFSKPYGVAGKLCELQREELLSEGDVVRKLGLTPIPYLDRRVRWYSPDMNVKLGQLAHPCFRMLVNVLPETLDLLEGSELVLYNCVCVCCNSVVCMTFEFQIVGQVMARHSQLPRPEGLDPRREIRAMRMRFQCSKFGIFD